MIAWQIDATYDEISFANFLKSCMADVTPGKGYSNLLESHFSLRTSTVAPLVLRAVVSAYTEVLEENSPLESFDFSYTLQRFDPTTKKNISQKVTRRVVYSPETPIPYMSSFYITDPLLQKK